jgi:RNA-directed DNA polymerase
MLLETLQLQSGMSAKRLASLEKTASARYKVYYIPKKDGSLRMIEHPSREIKALQRWLNVYLLRGIPQHVNATAYSKGNSIKSNAARHLGTKFTVRIDLKEFFHSFKEAGIRKFLFDISSEYKLQLDDRDVRFAAKVFCRNGALTIGAPTSPALTNRMMYNFDHSMTAYAEAGNLVYTRYADDIFVSSYHPNNLCDVISVVKGFLGDFSYAKLKINNKKTIYLSRKYQRKITGITITPTNKISVGRDSKRKIKGMIWRFKENRLLEDEKNYMSGYLAFLNDVEPTFVDSLVKKYGKKLVSAASSSGE